MEHEGIWQEDIDRLRRSIKLGDKITVNTYNPDNLSGSARNPVGKKRLPVSGIYPHLVTAYDKKSGLTYSRTYVDMLTPEPGKKGGVTERNPGCRCRNRIGREVVRLGIELKEAAE